MSVLCIPYCHIEVSNMWFLVPYCHMLPWRKVQRQIQTSRNGIGFSKVGVASLHVSSGRGGEGGGEGVGGERIAASLTGVGGDTEKAYRL